MINDILNKYGFTMHDIRSRRRNSKLIECKREIALYLRNKGLSYPKIGLIMGKDHTSVMNLLKVLGKNKKNKKNY
jgi:chromosomal replication initiation ATPase DnaA